VGLHSNVYRESLSKLSRVLSLFSALSSNSRSTSEGNRTGYTHSCERRRRIGVREKTDAKSRAAADCGLILAEDSEGSADLRGALRH
jgi:hypothetical protein